MISVLIPTHRPNFLRETVESVLDQTCSDFEIVVVPNQGAEVAGILPADPRIRVVPYEGPNRIGAIKRFAFTQGEGELLLELDHDDLLAPNALEKIVEAQEKTGASFVYSNFAIQREETGKPVTFGPYWGWKSRPAKFRDRDVTEMISFDPSPAAIAHIWYAPNHVRVWTKEGYWDAGGHDVELGVCDDHDLLIRTWLKGMMVRIDECLYLQREHENCTYLKKNAEIQRMTHAIYAKNIEKIVLAWCRDNDLLRFDLGAGFDKPPGWTGVDIHDTDVQGDLQGKWPWPDSSVGAFRAYDFLPHLPDKMHTMKELHRCLVPGGWLLSFTPSALGQGAFMDPTHCSYWVKNSFLYWTSRDQAKYIRNESVHFQEQRLVEEFPNDWHRQENIPYITFDGICLKDGYDGPGAHKI